MNGGRARGQDGHSTAIRDSGATLGRETQIPGRDRSDPTITKEPVSSDIAAIIQALERLGDRLDANSYLQESFEQDLGASSQFSTSFEMNCRLPMNGDIRSAYIENNGSLNTVTVYQGQGPNGRILDVVPSGNYKVIAIPDGIKTITCSAASGDSGLVRAFITTLAWTPETGIVNTKASNGYAQVQLVESAGVNATGPTNNTAVPANAANVTVKATAGRLFGITITTVGTTTLSITDGIGGAAILENVGTALGTFMIPPGNVFNTSLVVVGSGTNPAIVCHYA